MAISTTNGLCGKPLLLDLTKKIYTHILAVHLHKILLTAVTIWHVSLESVGHNVATGT